MPDTAVAAPVTQDLIEAIRAVVGERGLLTDPSDTDSACEDWRRLYRAAPAPLSGPATPRKVAAVVRLCAEAGVPIVTQGGNTSMVGGAVPAEDGSELVLSTARLNRVRDLDPVDMTLTIEAGVTLKAAQLAAAERRTACCRCRFRPRGRRKSAACWR
jgi:FAD/FMN-containing dehydrogenase